jgi:hypothetical protein
MAGPSKVEFPGQKKQRVRMRGTKQANEATANRIKRELAQLLEDPESKLPQMTWKGRLRWGRVDPVTKTLNELRKIIKKKNDVRWLNKRMMAKRGDPVAKAFAGSLHACHDEEFKMVGNFSSGSFGTASFIRRGDGKQGYLAGLQNHSHLTLRMLPWEDHAKRGMYFFTWKGGFVCTGPNPTPPDEWLEDVLNRSRFTFTKDDEIPLPVWVTEGLDRRRNHPSSTTLLFRCSRPSCLQSLPLKQTGHQKDGLKERPSLKPPLKELTRSSMHGKGSR